MAQGRSKAKTGRPTETTWPLRKQDGTPATFGSVGPAGPAGPAGPPAGPHAATHQPGGADAMAVDAVAATGSLRTLGIGAQQAAAGTDARFTDARTPLAHVHPQADVTGLVADLAAKEPANANIQAHVISAHAPANAQKNSDITIAEIEAKLIGVVGTHSHAAGAPLAHALMSASHSDTVAQLVTRGSLVYGNATPAWDELVIGAAARVLRSNGTDIVWAQVALATDVIGLLPDANLSANVALRNAANAFTGGEQTIDGAAGSAGAFGPRLSFRNVGGTIDYRMGNIRAAATDEIEAIAWFYNGVERMRISNAGVLTAPSIKASGLTAGSMLFAGSAGLLTQDNANIFWDDTNNRLGIGTALPLHRVDVRNAAGTITWAFGEGQMIGHRASADLAGCTYEFRKSRGGSVTAPTVLTAGDQLGAFLFSGYNDAWRSAAGIVAYAGVGWGAAGADAPGIIKFFTSTDGTEDFAERMSIDEAGIVRVNGSLRAASIVNDTGLAAGVYTPTLTAVANIDALTSAECQYLRVGNTVTVSGIVTVDVTTVAISSTFRISLPVASNFGVTGDCAGIGVSNRVIAEVRGDSTNNEAEATWTAGISLGVPFAFHFTYQVI